ncbi:hypothetical protein ASE00_19760 [Sphingomonas sp. Root710]|uniref:hypothetical protein n=1 Tax=Sphingomonas sp. Root710 TaxID=1736594 RepID=UPI0006F8DEDC|nr:hypothetical protein [Sphingomonas sp. Root710]KRB79349.1 hypothetical protein ASE00_19760 [Sphingomonas sp. Root710]
MARYFVFLMDGDSIIDRLDFEADDDAEALALLALRREQVDCDMWCGDRFVATIPKGTNPSLVTRERPGKS